MSLVYGYELHDLSDKGELFMYHPEVPVHIREGLVNYCFRHMPVGHFLTSIMQNDLKMTFARADHINLPRIYDIMKWLYNVPPGVCHGSPQQHKAWLEIGARAREADDNALANQEAQGDGAQG